MLSPFFGFFNRIGRVQFWLVAMLSAIVLVVPLVSMAASVATEAGTMLEADPSGEAFSQPAAQAMLLEAVMKNGPFMFIALIAFIWMTLSAHIQRLHDLDHSGFWFIAIIVVPFALEALVMSGVGTALSLLITAYLGFWPGTNGSNRFADARVGVMSDEAASTAPRGSYAAMENADKDGFVRTPRAKRRPA